MITKKLFAVLKKDGIKELLNYARFWAFPQRSQHYDQYRQLIRAGIGLEIGGPSRIFGRRGSVPVYADARQIDNCNFGSATVWEGSIDAGHTFKFNKRKNPGRQFVTEASDLRDIKDAAYDFVISSHCIEHLANPLRGLSEWIRVLKPGGILVLIFPHKGRTFDHRRPVTTLNHLIEDFAADMSEDDMTHLEEILELHDFERSPGVGGIEEFRQRSIRNLENRCLHHHVFDTRLAVEVLNHVGLQIDAVELFHPFHIAVTARKPIEQDQPVNNELFGMLDADFGS